MGYYLFFGLLSAAMGGALYVLLFSSTDWNPYAIWLIAWSVTAFAVYGLDKGLSKVKGGRVPEAVLHLLALLGGFPGAWLGMAAFRHKTNLRKHPLIWLVLLLGTVGHAVLVYFWFFRGE